MRIDKFLKVSRILKRRETANKAADTGRVKVNGKIVKPSFRLCIGDIIELDFNSGIIKIKVLQLKETVKKEEVSTLYQIITE